MEGAIFVVCVITYVTVLGVVLPRLKELQRAVDELRSAGRSGDSPKPN